MKSYLFLISLMLLFFLNSCEESISSYGDKNLASYFEILSIEDSVGAYDYNFINPEPTDTTYVYFRKEYDTTFMANGTVDEITTDTIYFTGMTAKLYTIPLILLPKYKNQLYIHVASNARWQAPTIPFSSTLATWIKNKRIGGTGEAIITYDINPRSSNPNSTLATRRKPQDQYIMTQDSTVMYKLTFSQKSMIED